MKNIIIFLAFVFFSCQQSAPGTVVKKWYEPARTYTVTLPVTVNVGKSRITNLVPHRMHDGEDWCISVEHEGKEKTYYLAKDQYNSIKVGDMFYPDKANKKDTNNKKERQ